MSVAAPLILEPSRARDRIVAAARACEGTVYLWAGKRPKDGGLDCSGLATWAWWVAGCLQEFPRFGWSAAQQFADLPAIDEADALPGDAAYYSSTPDGRISHVVLLIEGGKIIGANGGDRPAVSEWDAARGWITQARRESYLERMRARGACVSVRESPHFRSYLRGFRRAPNL